MEQLEDLNFSKALAHAKKGKSIARAGWNGQGIFVKAQFPDEHSKMGQPYLYVSPVSLGGSLVPWVPGQPDLFGEDWMVLDY